MDSSSSDPKPLTKGEHIEVTDSGRFRLTFRPNNERLIKESFDSLAEARRLRDTVLHERTVHIDSGAVTVEQWSKLWIAELPKRLSLDEADRKKLKDIPNVRSRLKHIIASDLGKKPLIAVTENDAKGFVKWLAKRLTQRVEGKEETRAKGRRKRKKPISQNPLSAETRRRIITVLRTMFQDAIDDPKNRCKCRGRPNPITDQIKVPGERTKPIEKDVPLYPEHQKQLIAAMGAMLERFIVIIAIWTGLRRGELWNLELCDVHLDEPVPGKPGETRCYIHVKYGGKDHAPPKNGKPRCVDLMGLGLWAMRQWLAGLAKYAPYNPHNLVFPTPRRKAENGNWFKGGCRRAGRPDWWVELQNNQVLGEKKFWWHALRHTCATGLLNGWFGRKWSIDEVAEFLGHSSSEITRIYAKVTQDTMRSAAAETNLGWRALTDPEPTSPVPVPLAPAPTPTPAPPTLPPAPPPVSQPAEESIRGGIADLIARAVREGNMAVAQALMTAAGAASTPSAPTSVTSVPAPVPVPVSQPVPAVGPIEPALINVSRTGRRVSRSPRASRVSSSGDTEGPRRRESAYQLTPSEGDSTLPGHPPSPGSSTVHGRAGFSPEALARTLSATGVRDDARVASAASGATPVAMPLQPKRRAAVRSGDGLSTVPASDKPNTVATALVPDMAPSTLRLPALEPLPGNCPRLVQDAGLTEQYPTLNSSPLRSTEPKVGRSNRPGRAEQLPIVSSKSGPTLGQPLDGPDPRATEASVDIGPTESDATTPPAHVPAWLAALQAVSEAPRSTADGVAPAGGLEPAELSSPQPAASLDSTPADKAQELLDAVSHDHDNAPRIAEDLAMLVLLSRADYRHHRTARLVMKDANNKVANAAQLAIRLLGSPPKAMGKKKGRA